MTEEILSSLFAFVLLALLRFGSLFTFLSGEDGAEVCSTVGDNDELLFERGRESSSRSPPSLNASWFLAASDLDLLNKLARDCLLTSRLRLCCGCWFSEPAGS